jgi:methionyl-tRNA formyltransferase
MALDATLDTGPVYASQRVDIGSGETAGELQERLAVLGAEALLPVVEALAAGTAVTQAQALVGVTHAGKIRKEEAGIEWRQSAPQIERQVRAFNPWPVAESWLGEERVRIWRARALTAAPPPEAVPGSLWVAPDGGVNVACGTGTLAIDTLQLPGKQVIRGRDFAHSRALAGRRFGAPAA